MSVLVVLKVPGDTATFESFVASNKERVLQVSERAKAGGCLAHRFAVGEGHILVVDEWETPEQIQSFFPRQTFRRSWERWAQVVNRRSLSRTRRGSPASSELKQPPQIAETASLSENQMGLPPGSLLLVSEDVPPLDKDCAESTRFLLNLEP